MRSPTIERYLRLKLEHPQAVVFVTTGAFCQTFFEDATECGRVLRVAVRDLAAESEPARIPTCGIPKARLEKYLGLLRQAGREVHVE
jgi:DNA mismatch repair protein MutS